MADIASTGFAQAFNAIDSIIMSAVGDDITLTPPTGAEITTKCVLSAPMGKGSQDGFVWGDNIAAKIDIASAVVELPESAVSGLGKDWSALYFGRTYIISEALPKGDGLIMLILNERGNDIAVPNGWM